MSPAPRHGVPSRRCAAAKPRLRRLDHRPQRARVGTGSAVEIFLPDQAEPSGIALATFFAIGTVIGSLFAVVVFAASALSLPMFVDRRTDAVTAVVTSVNAVLRNKRAMLVWAILIVLCVAIGFATALIGLAVTMPLIGHATWHAYREAIDASAWPQNV